jgi:hypothetical protein
MARAISCASSFVAAVLWIGFSPYRRIWMRLETPSLVTLFVIEAITEP